MLDRTSSHKQIIGSSLSLDFDEPLPGAAVSVWWLPVQQREMSENKSRRGQLPLTINVQTVVTSTFQQHIQRGVCS